MSGLVLVGNNKIARSCLRSDPGVQWVVYMAEQWHRVTGGDKHLKRTGHSWGVRDSVLQWSGHSYGTR